MLFRKKKVEQILEMQRERSLESSEQYNFRDEIDEVPEKLTAKDVLAIVISALLVFGPIALVLAGLMFLVYKSI